MATKCPTNWAHSEARFGKRMAEKHREARQTGAMHAPEHAACGNAKRACCWTRRAARAGRLKVKRTAQQRILLDAGLRARRGRSQKGKCNESVHACLLEGSERFMRACQIFCLPKRRGRGSSRRLRLAVAHLSGSNTRAAYGPSTRARRRAHQRHLGFPHVEPVRLSAPE